MIVNSETGVMDDGCPYCAFLSMSGDFNDDEVGVFESQPVPEGHVMIEVMSAEMDDIRKVKYQVVRNGEIVMLDESEVVNNEERLSAPKEPKYKVNIEKAAPKLEDRAKVEDLSKPIEAEGLGGKEIIGYDEKPVWIVVERELSVEKEEAGRE